MLQKLIAILFFCICYSAADAQVTSVCECSANFGGVAKGDNYLDVNFSDVEVKEVGGSNYLYFTLKLKCGGTWYNDGGTAHTARKRYLSALDMRFNFNKAVFGENENVVSRIEVVEFAMDPEGEGVTFGDAYAGGSGWTNVIPFTSSLLLATLSFSENGDGTLFKLTTADYLYAARFRWKLKDGVSGNTGVSLRIPKPEDYADNTNGAYPSTAFDCDTKVPFGICVTGESLDVPVGGGTPVPTIASITGSTSLCAGAQNATYTATTDVPATSFSWKVKNAGGADVTASVIDGAIGTTAAAVLNWKTTTPAGNYSVCATATNATGTGAEFCMTTPVTINGAPALALSEKDSKTRVCANTSVNLVATAGLKDYTWYKDGSQVSTTGTTNTYAANVGSPVGGLVTYKVKAASAAGCEATKELVINVNSLPVAGITTTIAGGAGRPANKYGEGDYISMVAKNIDESRYTYSWSDGTKTVAGTRFDVAGATAASYNVTLTVTEKSAPFCSSTANVALTKDPSCGITNVVLTGTDSKQICTNGICRLTATVTTACDGGTVLAYAWYKDGVRLDSIKVSNEKTNVFTATTSGTYVVKAYTLSGVKTATVGVTAKAATADKVVATKDRYVAAGGSLWLAANCNTAKTWQWEPTALLNKNNEQFVDTKPIPSDKTSFYVYATDQNGCMSVDSTLVHISNQALTVNILPSARPIVICKGGSVTLEAQVTGGSGDYSYVWNKDINTPSGSPTTNKTNFFKDAGLDREAKRYVEVTDNVTHITGLAIVDLSIMDKNEPSLTINGGGTICEGNDLKVSTVSSGVTDYTWYILDKNTGTTTSISKAASTDTIILSKRGSYKVWVAGKTATCTSDTTGKGVNVNVNGFDLKWKIEPTAYKLGADLIAEAEASNGNVPYKYTWNSLKAGKQVSGVNDNPNKYQVTGASENTYLFKVTAEDQNTCRKTLEKKVDMGVSGGLNLVLASKNVSECTGGAALLKATASGGSSTYNFKWYKVNDEANPLQSSTLSGSGVTDQLVAGNFATGDKIVVKVTDNSSPVLMRTDTVTVTVTGTAAPVVDAGANVTIANGTSTILFGEVKSGTATEWIWSKAANLSSLSEVSKQYPQTARLNAQTTYSVYVKDAAGCYSLPDDVTVSVNNSSTFAVSIADPGTICMGNAAKLSATATGSTIASWEWLDASGQLADLSSATPLFTASKAGAVTVYLKATDNNGVVATASRTITVQNATAPILQLSGLNGGAVCSAEALKVSASNGVVLGSSTWYLNDAVVQSGVSMVYRPNVTSNSVLDLKVVATLSGVGCPAQNEISMPITVYPRPKLAFAASSSPLAVVAGAEVQVTAEVTNDDASGMDYTYVWKHAGNTTGVSYTDEGTTVSKATAAASKAVLVGGASTATQPYYFQVYTVNGNSCHSDTITRTIVVDGDALFVNLKSKYGDLCNGGGAVLVAEAVGVTGGTYKWYKNGTLIAGESGQELVLNAPLNTTDSYKVEVTASGKSGVSTPLSLTASSKVATTLLTEDLKIPSGTKTALWVASADGSVISSWQWSPKDKLMAGENTLAYPNTVVLTANQDYKVYGVSADNCVTPSANVRVSVVNGIVPPVSGGEGQPDPTIFAYVYPSQQTICVGNMLDLQTVVWGNPTGATTYEWTPASRLSASNVANPVFNQDKSAPAGTYSYLVKAKRGSALSTMARVDIKVVPGTLPDLAVDMDNTGMACAGSDLVMKIVNKSSVTIKKYTWFIDGVKNNTVTGNKYTWPSVAASTKYHVKVIAETEGNCLSAAIELDSIVKPALKLNALQLADSCGQVKLFADAGTGASYTWSFVTGGSDLQMAGTKDTIYLKPKAALTASSVPYEVAVSVSPQGGGCQSKGGMTGKLYFQPKVKLQGWTPQGESTALPYMMAEKGTTPFVYVDANQSEYVGGANATEVWTASGALVASKGAAKVNNIVKDDTVRLLVKNKEASSCFVKDSLPVYLYPEAPKLRIDTVDKSFVKVALYLTPGVGDYYTIWSRKWDPYCLTSIFTGDQAYVKELTAMKLANSVKLWREPAMDTLEYYYATGGRTVQGRDWAGKTTSDTVGYYLFNVNINATLANDNYMAIYFDFAAMDCPTTVEMGARISKTSASPMFNLTYYNYAQQKPVQTTYVVANPGTSVATAFRLTQDKGAVVIRPATKIPGKFMQYGKLPKSQFDVYRTNSGTNINWGYILPQKAHQLGTFEKLVERGADLGDVAQQIYTWSFETQKPNMITVMNYKPFGTFPVLKPLMFIKINPKSTVSGSYIWK